MERAGIGVDSCGYCLFDDANEFQRVISIVEPLLSVRDGEDFVLLLDFVGGSEVHFNSANYAAAEQLG
jgi:hypothetical protein